MADVPRRIVRLDITGAVQGVGYRAWTEREAVRLGLAGWVRNRPDGSVEALLAGEAAAVEAMVVACRRGPPHARVEHITLSPADEADLARSGRPGFVILREK